MHKDQLVGKELIMDADYMAPYIKNESHQVTFKLKFMKGFLSMVKK